MVSIRYLRRTSIFDAFPLTLNTPFFIIFVTTQVDRLKVEGF